MEKAGMKFEGILRQVKINKKGEFYDLAVYSILKSDFISWCNSANGKEVIL